MGRKIFATLSAFAAFGAFGVASAPATAQDSFADFEAAFDSELGTKVREPLTYEAVYDTGFEKRIAQLADGADGRIGVAAIDLTTGREISILGDMRFPMASTSKIAIAATFMEGVDNGRWSLNSEFPLLIPQRSARFSGSKAPVSKGKYLPARTLLNLMITRSSNTATDALLDVVGGPKAVNRWMREKAGIQDFELSRDIATLVRDDGEFDPVTYVDKRDSASPRAMAQLLAGLHRGDWLSRSSSRFIVDTMQGTRTGSRRMTSVLPDSARLAHKTGTLNRTASDIGIFYTPDGRPIAAAIYVTGQSASMSDEARNKSAARLRRDQRIASITQALYEGYSVTGRNYARADYSPE
ncbi:serine hydrolase [Qipengyuania sp. JC766]|uniref:serine hydrolase n=1 Tax=Qipengyuania sp. JC766 TaxID=3232139 RepID=UPI003458714C